jgi:nitrogen fixation/metabolism regulation signal transduction histidine kinase
MVYPLIIYNLFEYFMQIISAPHEPITSERVKELQTQVLLLLGVLQLVFLVITFIISIFLSHRIAGPLYRLRKSMEEVAKGNFDQRINFRKADHFMELQDVFNEMIQYLSVRRWR